MPATNDAPEHPSAIDQARAVFVDTRTLVAPAPPPRRRTVRTSWLLHWSATASCRVEGGQVVAEDLQSVELAPATTGLDAQQRQLHPDLVDMAVLRLPQQWRRSVPEMLTGQLLLARCEDGVLKQLTGVQLGPVLDVVHAGVARDDELGARCVGESIEVALWAPTAQRVTLLLWPADAGQAPPPETARRRMMMRERHGTWRLKLGREHLGARYQFEVQVYSPLTRRIETNRVTDPCSAALTLDSRRSVLVDLTDPAAMPPDWASSWGPHLERLVDAAVYELHVRDFSMADDLVPAEHRGSYLAFTHDGRGARHLRSLARAGLNTVHLLPCFDVCSIPETHALPGPDEQQLSALPPDSHAQQRLVMQASSEDRYNWGYDPYHWGVPEGSYASSAEAADGLGRVDEFRAMVHALHGLGLRVVMDQVFTHTGASGQSRFSVLDRIVPGYYHRLDERGLPQASTCMNNVATERVMAEKLMIDMVLRWVRDYHVDGFRFDLMGHSSAENMANLRDALDALTMERDGVDGRGIYLYGEGWNFGEVADNALFVQATQGQLAHTRIATFNDRIRDAVRGGRPFDEDPRRQGFGTGLAGDPNGARVNRGAQLGGVTDLVMLGLAGNLADYELACSDGQRRRGDRVDYFGRNAGYASEPVDALNYVDAHDNETLWDALTLKLPPDLPMSERIRMNSLCLACVTLGQSPFLWHAGADLLRSKSLDRNSYDSGDWFNRLDWTGADNGFGRGLPPAPDNMTRWPWLRPLLRRAELKPSPEDVAEARDRARDLLRLRRSTVLFRLGTAERIRTKLNFPVSGTEHARPGVIVMHVDDRRGHRLDPDLLGVVAVFNATGQAVAQPLPALAGERLVLNPVQARGDDELVRQARHDNGLLMVPARTVVVFNHLPA
ncbi:pullulanase-type alpha-1,6-glucosidase [Luteococcus peritonei]|uniref:Pullulanase-type alpha-1,6-glucosidase n=1 Tax=Luteococcus peritonei TaxID=88874 RepID=A0ABW4RX43_9ACTN